MSGLTSFRLEWACSSPNSQTSTLYSQTAERKEDIISISKYHLIYNSDIKLLSFKKVCLPQLLKLSSEIINLNNI